MARAYLLGWIRCVGGVPLLLGASMHSESAESITHDRSVLPVDLLTEDSGQTYGEAQWNLQQVLEGQLHGVLSEHQPWLNRLFSAGTDGPPLYPCYDEPWFASALQALTAADRPTARQHLHEAMIELADTMEDAGEPLDNDGGTASSRPLVGRTAWEFSIVAALREWLDTGRFGYPTRCTEGVKLAQREARRELGRLLEDSPQLNHGAKT